MAKRGFFAELAHQQRLAEKRREQEARAAARAHAAAVRKAEQAQRQAEQARVRAQKAAVADQKRAVAEAKRLHLEAMQAEVESRNAELGERYEQLDTLLAATLDVDDHVDLEALRVVAEHPPFARTDLEVELAPPPPIQPPPEPQWVEPAPPKGLSGAFGGKKRHEATRTAAWQEYQANHQAWQQEVARIPALQLEQMQAHQAAESHRLEELARARTFYDQECAARQAEVDETNRSLDELIAGLAVGAAPQVQEYVSIVLSNSVYPDFFPVENDFEFDDQLHELTLRITMPAPDEIPTQKLFRYNKAQDEIAATDHPKKAIKDRYASLVHQVALRAVHEVFEADRTGCIQTISLTVSTDSIDPATGQIVTTPFVAFATDRERFEAIDLSLIVPKATLEHLGALVSKDPFGMVAIDTSKGVRG